MTTEEKAKAYDEAWGRAKERYNNMPLYDLEYVFPELKESEDEKIRKVLLAIINEAKGNGCNAYYAVPMDDILALLEKQGEQPFAIRWYDVSLIPQEMEELLVEWDSEDATWHEIAFYHADTKTFWNGTIQVENVTRWCYIIDLLEKQKPNWSEQDGMFARPLTPFRETAEVATRFPYVDNDLKPIAEFIMDYSLWDLRKDVWNQPVIVVPLFRVLDALIQRGKPYCEGE